MTTVEALRAETLEILAAMTLALYIEGWDITGDVRAVVIDGRPYWEQTVTKSEGEQ